MSSKRFTVVDTRSNKTKTFESNATTVGELKADLRREGIDPDGMAIQEGLTKTELGEDSDRLPHDVAYKGGTTNNLVFRLTQKEKKIKSGMMSRKEAFAEVKRLNLQDAVMARYGRNFTQVSTENLVAVIEAANNGCTCCKEEITDGNVADAVALLVEKLVKEELLDEEDGEEVIGLLGINNAPIRDYSDDEIVEMFKDMD